MLENDDRLEFIRQLYGKYNQPLDPQKEKLVLESFDRDFDTSLSAFYTKYSPAKLESLTPELRNQLKSGGGFISTQEPEDDYRWDDADLVNESGSRAGQNLRNSASNIVPGIANAVDELRMIPNIAQNNFNKLLHGAVDLTADSGLITKASADSIKEVLQKKIAMPGALGVLDWSDNKTAQLVSDIDSRKKGMKETLTLDEIRNPLEAAAWAIDGATGYLPSIVVGAATGGYGFVPMVAGGMMAENISKKAEMSGDEILDVISKGEYDMGVPIVVGTVFGLLERYGFKSLGKYAEEMMKSSTARDAFKSMLANSGRQGLINWLEAGLAQYNTDYSEYRDLEHATVNMAEFLFSKEGLNAGAQAAAGTLAMGGTGRGIKTGMQKIAEKVSNQEKTQVEEAGETAKAKKESEIDTKMEAAQEAAPVMDEALHQEMQSIIAEVKQAEAQTAKTEAETDSANEVMEENQQAVKEKAKEETAEAPIIEETPTEKDRKATFRKVRDLSTLKQALQKFSGKTDKESISHVNTVAEFINDIVKNRAKRDGFSVQNWYQTRIAGIGTGKMEQEGLLGTPSTSTGETSFSPDGLAFISSIQETDVAGFIREFSKVLRKDLSTEEANAVSKAMGINLAEEKWSSQSSNAFADAFMDYIKEGKLPENLPGNTTGKITQVFEKLKTWISDIMSSAGDKKAEIMSVELREAFDNIVAGKDITQENISRKITEEANQKRKEDEQKAKEIRRAESKKTDRGNDEAGSVASKEGRRKQDNDPSVRVKRNADKIIDKYAEKEYSKGADGAYSKTSRNSMESAIKTAKAELAKEGISESQKKSLQGIADKYTKALEEVKEAHKASQERIKSINKAKEEAKEFGLNKKQIDEFVKKHPKATILEVSDGAVLFVDEGGEIHGYEFEDAKVVSKKMYEVNKEEKAKDKKLSAEEKAAESEKMVKAERQMTEMEHLSRVLDTGFRKTETTTEVALTPSQLERILERIASLAKANIDMDITGMFSEKETEKMVAKVFRKLVFAKINGSTLQKQRESINRMAEQIGKTINESDVISEALRVDLRDEFRTAMNNMEELFEKRELRVEAKEAKKEAAKIKGTVMDAETTVQPIGASGPMTSFVKKVFGMFGMPGQLVLVDMSRLEESYKDSAKNREALFDAVVEATRRDSYFKTEEDVLEGATKTYNSIIDEYKGGGMKISSPFSDVAIIMFDGNLAPGRQGQTVAHELGHLHMEHYLDRASKKVKDAITKDYRAFLAKRKDEQSKNQGEMSDEDLFRSISSVWALDQKEAKYRGMAMDLEGKNTHVYDAEYLTSVEEWYAERFADFLASSERTNTVLGKFFDYVITLYQDMLNVFGDHFERSPSLISFFESTLQVMEDKSDASIKMQKNAKMNDAVELVSKIAETEGSILVANNQLVELSEPKARAVRKAKIARLKNDLAKYNNDIKKLWEQHTQLGGKFTEQAFRDRAEGINRKKQEEALDRDLGGLLGFEMEFSFQKPAASMQGNTIAARTILKNRIVQALNGKFTTEKEFTNYINSFNEMLKTNAIAPVTKAEAKEILLRTDKGRVMDLKAPLLKEFKIRPTKEIADVISSMGESLSARAKAVKEAEAILNGNKVSQEDKIKAAKLMMVGISNASVDQMDMVKKANYAKAISKGNYEDVFKREMLAKNSYAVGAAKAMYGSFFGGEKIGENTYRVNVGKKEKFEFKIFDLTKSHKVGEIIEHLGKMYEVTEAFAPGDNFKENKVKFISAISQKFSKAEKDRKGIMQRVGESLTNITLWSQNIESLVSVLASRAQGEGLFKSDASVAIGEEGFRRAAVRSRKGFAKTEKAFIGAVQQIYGVSEKDARRELVNMRTEVVGLKYQDNNGNTVTKDYYVSELMTYFAYLQQESLAERFENMKKQTVEATDARFWNESKRAAIVDALSDQHKQVVGAVSGSIMEDIYQDLNTTHRNVKGYDLIKLKNYFPVSTYLSDKTNASEVDVDSKDFASFINSINNSNTIAREATASPLMPTDFVSTTLRYAAKANHFAHYAEPMSTVSKFLQQGEYRSYLESVHGKKIMNEIDYHLANIAGNAPANYVKNAMVDIMRGLTISGAFMANLTMFPKQMSSFAAYMFAMPIKEWGAYYTKVATNPIQMVADARAILNTEFIRARLAEGTGANIDTINLMLNSMENEINKSKVRVNGELMKARISSVLFFSVKAGDVGAIVMGGMPYWNHLQKEGMAKYGNAAQAMEYAEIKFEESTSRTQQSKNMLDLNRWQTAGSIQSLFVTFMSTPILYGRILSGSLHDIYRGKDKATRLNGIKNAALFGIILPALFQMTAGATADFFLGDEDEDDLQNNALFRVTAMFASAMVQHIPILGPIAQNLVDTQVLGRDFDINMTPSVGIVAESIPAAVRLIERSFEEDDINWDEESLHRDIGKATKSLGINYSGTRNLAKAWSEFDESIEKDWKLLVGYSPFALGIED